MDKKDEEIKQYLNKIIYDKKNFLDFKNEDTHYSTHGYHNYPATMIPQLPKLFIDSISKFQNINSVYDPFMGSGTTLVESRLHGLNSVGVDLNPLAKLMADVKTKIINSKELVYQRNVLYKNISNSKKLFNKGKMDINYPTFKRISYWFKDYVIIDLQIIKDEIMKIHSLTLRKFFLLSFSSTVRYVSNTRNSEFKMYRMSAKNLDAWHPNVFKKYQEITNKNIELNNNSPYMSGKVKSILGSSDNTPQINDSSLDMLITSPPYGDSKTTVAYGQFSRTSLQWLDLDELHSENVPKLDSMLLGGKVKSKKLKKTGSAKLDSLLKEIAEVDKKRALQVSQFYEDLSNTLKEIKRVMKPNSYQFWVTSNRTVKGVKLTTDEIITELYNNIGVKKIADFNRNIPNKRMPSKNSPTNKKGKSSKTMAKENIVIYKTIK